MEKQWEPENVGINVLNLHRIISMSSNGLLKGWNWMVLKALPTQPILWTILWKDLLQCLLGNFLFLLSDARLRSLLQFGNLPLKLETGHCTPESPVLGCCYPTFHRVTPCSPWALRVGVFPACSCWWPWAPRVKLYLLTGSYSLVPGIQSLV